MKRWKPLAILCLMTVICLGVVSVSAETPTPITPESEFIVNPLYPDLVVAEPLQAAPKLAAPIHTTIDAAAAQLREGLEDREPTISVGFRIEGDYSGVGWQVFDQAFVHTGVPTQGDYLLWHYKSCNMATTGYSSNGVYYLTFTYTMTYLTSAQQEAVVDNAVDVLLQQLNVANASDYEKVCAVYDYICQNVTYDTYGLNHGNNMVYTTYAALIDHSAVCQGYASLFYRLALELDVDARLIAGTGAGGPHGWNIVKLSGKYYNLDSTWDATLAQAGQPYEYFLKCEANFDDHYRNYEYTTSEFHSAYPMSSKDYAQEAASGTCGSNVQWLLTPDGVLTISGSGAMTSAPWNVNDVKQVIIRNGVTAICDEAFSNACNLTSVHIPDTVTDMGAFAFQGCSGLTSVTIGKSLKLIPYAAFDNCTHLSDVYYAGTEEQWKLLIIADGNAYFVNAKLHITGNMLVGWQLENGKWVYYENGVKVTNDWKLDSKGWCYLTADGTMATNSWIADSQGWCYVGSNGYCVTNSWQQDSKGWCYLDANGRMATNQWIKDSGGWCYVGADGYCITNSWMKDSKGWCYLDANGRMVYNQWVQDSHGWCYVGSSGYMVTNSWVMDSKGWCYIGADGYAVTNCWKQDSHGWCYLDKNGSMTKNAWVNDGGWYWLDGNGYMIYSTSRNIGGKTYYFNASGICTNP